MPPTPVTWSRSGCSGRLERVHPGVYRIAGAPSAVDGGAWMKGFEFALAGPIYAGTNEIQRNVIAERVLGLPRR